MIIRKATIQDIPQMSKIYLDAIQALAAQGVPQWQCGTGPSCETAQTDILTGDSYVAEAQGQILGTSYISFGVEPSYRNITLGQWQSSCSRYGFLHRVAVADTAKGTGIVSHFFRQAQQMAQQLDISVLRCDTHQQNLPMQKALEKFGFYRCGIIHLENGDPRVGYEYILPAAVSEPTPSSR